MATITVTMRDGASLEFTDARLSPSGHKVRLRHEAGFVIIQDAYGEVSHIPAADVAGINERPDR